MGIHRIAVLKIQRVGGYCTWEERLQAVDGSSESPVEWLVHCHGIPGYPSGLPLLRLRWGGGPRAATCMQQSAIPVREGTGAVASAVLPNSWPLASLRLCLPLSRKSLTALLVQEGMA